MTTDLYGATKCVFLLCHIFQTIIVTHLERVIVEAAKQRTRVGEKNRAKRQTKKRVRKRIEASRK